MDWVLACFSTVTCSATWVLTRWAQGRNLVREFGFCYELGGLSRGLSRTHPIDVGLCDREFPRNHAGMIGYPASVSYFEPSPLLP